MVLMGWLVSLPTRLRFSRRIQRRALQRRRDHSLRGAIAAEVLEARCLLSAAISGVSPSSGQTSGGTSVYVVGTGFTGVTGVMFGTVAASSFQVNSSTNITAIAPAHVSGAVDIQVLSTSGNSTINPQYDSFTYTQSAPAVTALSPSSGTSAGGTSVTITGTGFTGVSAISFGGTMASSFTVTSSTSITAIAPSHMAGAVDVLVIASTGTSPADPAHDQYTYSSTGPTISGVTPGTGTGSGGTSVTISGTGFTGVTAVTFGGTNASSFTVNSATSITAVAPSHTPGMVDVRVTAGSGQSAVTSSDQFVYSAPVIVPTVTGLGTNSGSTAGGTSVTIMGTNFTNVTSVLFGTVAAQSFTVNSSTSITAVSPAETAGAVDVKVVNSAGTSVTTSADLFTFQTPGPTVGALSPATGSTAGGISVTISGSNFMGASAVYFGAVAATSFTLNSPTSITAVAPAAAAGLVDVKVTTPYGTSAVTAADQFSYTSPGSTPTVTGLSTTSGPPAGGNSLTITGTNFSSVSAVLFGNVAAGSFTVNSSTSISATVPAQSAGTVDIRVTTNTGTSATSMADQYTYGSSPGSTTTPTVTLLSATAGSTVGGATITIFGSGFVGATAVKFGTTAATSFTVDSDGAIFAVVPAHAAGIVDVAIVNAAGTSAAVAADRYTFTAPAGLPTVTGLSRATGSNVGGDVVKISGTNFRNVSAVSFGSVAATLFVVESDGSIYATTPAGSAGTIDVTVTTDAGASAVSTADRFQFVAAATSGATGVAGTAPPYTTPTVTGLSTNSGALTGGDTVTITGANLSGATSVLFGSVEATGLVLNFDGTLTVTTPAGAAGTVDVVVKTFAGASPTGTADRFSYVSPPAAPTVTAIGSAIGATTGGSVITITGTNFTQVRRVSFGDRDAVSFTVNSPTSISAVAPGHSAGLVDISVTTTGGTSAAVVADRFTYSKASPIVTGIDVSSGFSNGGTTITLFGGNLASATGVYFGTTAAQSFTINPDGTITAVAPAHAAGAVDVTVSSLYGPSAPHGPDLFTYVASGSLPAVNLLSSGSGPAGGGTLVMVNGANFVGVTAVKFGTLATSFFQVLSPGTLVVRSPAAAAAGTVHISVTTAAGTSAAVVNDQFTYTLGAPVISSLSAPSGFTTGGDTITINGSNFTGTSSVKFGGAAAASFTVVSDSQLTVVTAPHAAGALDITIVNPQGTSAVVTAGRFAFTPAGALPTVIALNTTSGSTFGGTTVVITGTNFTNVAGIKFGTVDATSFTILSPTSISVVTPSVAVGSVDVKVTTTAGSSTASAADRYTFTMAAPTVASISKASGFSNGGGSVTIYGDNLAQATGIYFGATAATSFTVNADGSLTAVAPAGTAGNVHITVQTPGGTSVAGNADLFTVTAAGTLPAVAALSASTGSILGGQTVTITGANFTDVTGVSFGGVAVTDFVVDSPTSLTVVTPAKSAGPVDVRVTTSAGTSAVVAADQFNYQLAAPIVTAISMASGLSSGGDAVTITGFNLAGASAVLFGGTPATSFVTNLDGSITAIAPAKAAGTYNITVQTASGTSAPSAAGRYIVTPAGTLPTVTTLGRTTGTTAGGDLVTITGANFTRVTAVTFGGVPARSFTVVSPTRIIATSPALAAATVDVKVTTAAGTSAASAVDLFQVAAPLPTVSLLSNSSGLTTGGDVVTIFGNDLAGATAVYFGATPAASFTQNGDGSITAVAPAKSAGTFGVTVTTPAGTSMSGDDNRFTYIAAGALPTVTALSTPGGAVAGGQLVTITGANFGRVTGVSFGGVPATAFYVDSPTSLVAVSPPQAAGTVNVTVMTSAGTSTTSTATQFSVTTAGPPTLTVSTTHSYYVSPWPMGRPGSAAMIQTGIGGGSSIAGLITDYTAPSEWDVPTVNPVTNYTGSGMTTTDGGTVVVRGTPVVSPIDGMTLTVSMTDTITFTLLRTASYNPGGSGGSSHTHIFRRDSVVTVTTLVAPDGTGYQRTDNLVTSHTYDAYSANQVSTVTLDSDGTASSSEHQYGYESASMPLLVDAVDQSNSHTVSHQSATFSGSVVDVTYSGSAEGFDHYVRKSDNDTEHDQLVGRDAWYSDNEGTFHRNADGTTRATSNTHDTGNGDDVYLDSLTDRVASTSPVDGGTTVVIDLVKSSDVGRDHYNVSSNAMASRTVDGTVRHTEWHDDHDDGTEEFKVTDRGLVVTKQTLSDGTVLVATDNFNDSNDDVSRYTDSDFESPDGGGWSITSTSSSGASGEEDDFKAHDEDVDKFSAGDDAQVVLTHVFPTGGVTTITIVDKDGDSGQLNGQDDVEDDETLPASGTRADHITFDDAGGLQEKGFDTATITIITLGQVAPDLYENLQETISLTGRTTFSNDATDDGKEDDSASGDSESDVETDHSDLEAQIDVDVVLVDQAIIVGGGGRREDRTVRDHFTDSLKLRQHEDVADQHGMNAVGGIAAFSSATPLPGEIDTDHVTDNEHSSLLDKMTDSASVQRGVFVPVTNGWLTLVEIGESDASDIASDSETDNASGDLQGPAPGQTGPTTRSGSDSDTEDFSDNDNGTSLDQIFQSLTIVDPITHIITDVLSGDLIGSKFQFTLSDDEKEDSSFGAGSASAHFSERDDLRAHDQSSDTGPLIINISGGNVPGVTSSVSLNLIHSSSGGHTAVGEDTFTAHGTDSGDVKFDTVDDAFLSGKTHASRSQTVNTDDGHGSTVNSTETLDDQGTLGFMDTDTDKGEEDFADTNGQPASDSEHDAEEEHDFLSKGDHLTEHSHTILNSVAGGLTRYFDVTNDNSDDLSTTESIDATDAHNQSDSSSPGADAINSDDDLHDKEHSHNTGTLTLTFDGADAQGRHFHIAETTTLDSQSDDDLDDDDVSSSTTGGGLHDTEHLSLHDHWTLGLTDSLTATTTTVDATTGITTITVDTISTTGTGNESEVENETATRNPGSVSDTASENDDGTATVSWNSTETVTKKNAAGQLIGTPTTTTDVGSDTPSWHTSISRGTEGHTTIATTGTRTGQNNSSGGVGNSTWSNEPMDSATLATLFSEEQFADDIGDDEAGTTPGEVGAPHEGAFPQVVARINKLDQLVALYMQVRDIRIELRESPWYDFFRRNYDIVQAVDSDGNQYAAFQVDATASEYDVYTWLTGSIRRDQHFKKWINDNGYGPHPGDSRLIAGPSDGSFPDLDRIARNANLELLYQRMEREGATESEISTGRMNVWMQGQLGSGGTVEQIAHGLLAAKAATVSIRSISPSALSNTNVPGVVSGLRNRGAFGGMTVTGETRSGMHRIGPDWRSSFGPSAMRRHHLVPISFGTNRTFLDQMNALGFTDAEAIEYLNRQIADIPNALHIQVHVEGWNPIWNTWLERHPDFILLDLRAQVRSMMHEFDIPRAALGGPKYGR